MKTAIITPASAKSSRLPRKPLLDDTGKPLVLHTYEAALQSKLADEVWIAADEECFRELVRKRGYDQRTCNAIEINGEYRNGTQRVAAATKSLGDRFDIIVNLQVDEPLVTGDMLDKLIRHMQTPLDPSPDVFPELATLVGPEAISSDRGIVKVAVDRGVCWYFSRAPIAGARSHIGCYAFSRNHLEYVSRLEQRPLSAAEGLEQLDWLWTASFDAVEVDHAPLSINTRANYDRFVELMRHPV